MRTKRYRGHDAVGHCAVAASSWPPYSSLFPAPPQLFPTPPPSMQQPGGGGDDLVIWQPRHKLKTTLLFLHPKRLWTEGTELPLSGLPVTHCSSITTSVLNQNWISNSTFLKLFKINIHTTPVADQRDSGQNSGV